jgi:hypothetical protein
MGLFKFEQARGAKMIYAAATGGRVARPSKKLTGVEWALLEWVDDRDSESVEIFCISGGER